MANGHHPLSSGAEQVGHIARGLALAAAGASGHHGHHGHLRPDHGRPRTKETKVATEGTGPRCGVHHVLVRDVRVGEDDLVDLVLGDDRSELGLGADGNALGVVRTGELGGIGPEIDAGDLRGRESHDPIRRIITKGYVEVVEVAASSSHDDGFLRLHRPPCFQCRARWASPRPLRPGKKKELATSSVSSPWTRWLSACPHLPSTSTSLPGRGAGKR